MNLKIHMLEQDAYNRWGLLIVGAFGAYSLGANNIANVMGVFVPAQPFTDIHLFNNLSFSGAQQLFLLGALAIGVGVFTYSRRVMLTVGSDLFKLTPVAALVVVFSEALVLFLFASKSLEQWLISHGLPAFPLAPVSSSQAVIGGIIGVGLVKRGRGIRYEILGKITLGWIATPLVAGFISFVALFFVQNVFEQQVVNPQSVSTAQQVQTRKIFVVKDLPVLNSQELSNRKINLPLFFLSQNDTIKRI
jgi:PiT family inorganic phosphate transporter